MPFEPVIGLEIHTQLATHTKIFCSCSTKYGATPNANTCPVCLGLPGALPVLNKKVLEYAIRLGLATHCHIRLDSQFARKNYFYPDLPKAYQISQFDRPICENGWIDIELEGTTKRIGIARIHLEEDAGKLVHQGVGGTWSYVDLNRAGVPLLEIVSQPDLHTPEEAKIYMETIHALVTCLQISDGDMEKGNLRCDANVSLRPLGQKALGIRTEIKNLNSFRFVQQALAYEICRQTDELQEGNPIRQETLLWDTERKLTYSMRSKEEAHDYRYFPDPDLPIAKISQEWVDAIATDLPELPHAKQQRFVKAYGLRKEDAQRLVQDNAVAHYFEKVVACKAEPQLAFNWVMMELGRMINETQKSLEALAPPPEQLATLIGLVADHAISSNIAKTVLEEMLQTQKTPHAIIQSKGLQQISDTTALETLVAEVIQNNEAQVAQYREGKTKVFGFFVGQVMKASKGKANPQMVNQLLKDKLNPPHSNPQEPA